MTPQFFPQGLGVNADADVGGYVETLQTIVVKLPWIDNVASGGRPLYCEAWRGVVEKEANKHPHSTKSSSLMEAIARAMEDMNKDNLMKACSCLRTQIGSVIESEGGYTE
ncbi:hypothetical protein ACTXT7_007205 [Hymenolepis weldensis]